MRHSHPNHPYDPTRHTHHHAEPQSFSVTLTVDMPAGHHITPARQREIVNALRRHLLDSIPGSTHGDGDTWSGVQ